MSEKGYTEQRPTINTSKGNNSPTDIRRMGSTIESTNIILKIDPGGAINPIGRIAVA
jgi:hypothetical protein